MQLQLCLVVVTKFPAILDENLLSLLTPAVRTHRRCLLAVFDRHPASGGIVDFLARLHHDFVGGCGPDFVSALFPIPARATAVFSAKRP
jgi:hypothetical protein